MVEPPRLAWRRSLAQHIGQFVVDEVLHARVLQADGVDEARGGLPEALATVAVLAFQRQALAGSTAPSFQSMFSYSRRSQVPGGDDGALGF